MSLTFELCACMCVYEGLGHGIGGLGEYFKLDYVELLSMKEDVLQRRRGNTATMSIFT